MRVGELAPAVDLVDRVLLHEEVHALDAAVGDLAATGECCAVVHAHRAVHLDAEGLGLRRDDVRELGVAQQRLGRDTADVEAHPAPVLVLDHGHPQPELGGADRSHVTAGAGTENDDVIVSHACTVLRPSRPAEPVPGPMPSDPSG